MTPVPRTPDERWYNDMMLWLDSEEAKLIRMGVVLAYPNHPWHDRYAK